MSGSTLFSLSHTLKSAPIYDLLQAGMCCVLVASIIWWMKRRYTSKESGHPLPRLKTPPFSIFGSLYTFPSTSVMKTLSLPITAFLLQTLSGHRKLFEKEKLFVFDLGSWRMFQLVTPEAVEELLKSNTILQKASIYKFLMPWLGSGLITSTGSKWRSRRKLLTPSFHFDVLKDFLPIIDEQSRILIDILKGKLDEDFVDIVSPVTLCSLDIMCESILGTHVGAQRNSRSEYVQAVARTAQSVMDRMCIPELWLEPLFYISATGRQFRKDIKTLHNFTRKVIQQKKAALAHQSSQKESSDMSYYEPRKKRKALMDLLIEHQMKHQDITEEDIREEIDTFAFAAGYWKYSDCEFAVNNVANLTLLFFGTRSDNVNYATAIGLLSSHRENILNAIDVGGKDFLEQGHDTTSMGMSWALYLIGLYPEVQEKIHEELNNIFSDDVERCVTGEDLRDMQYLERVLKESQRLYPSVPLIGREVEKDMDFCGYRVRKGNMLTVNNYLLHRNPETFPDPEKFDPDRFLPENSIGRHPFAYVPFSAGPRNCIGQRFAAMEEKIAIANVLRNFHVKSLDQRDKLFLSAELILRPACPLRLKFTPRTSVISAAS